MCSKKRDIYGVFWIEQGWKGLEQYHIPLLEFLQKKTREYVVLCKEPLSDTSIRQLHAYTDNVYCQNQIIDRMQEWYADSVQSILFLDDLCLGPLYQPDIRAISDDVSEDQFLECGDFHFLLYHPSMLEAKALRRVIQKNAGERGVLSEIGRELERLGYKRKKFNLQGDIGGVPPFLSWGCLLDQDLDRSSCERPRLLMEYIENRTSYNSGMIWSHLLKICNVADLRNIFHLEYIFSDRDTHETEKIINKRVALIAHLHYEDLLEECFYYLDHVPEWVDLYLTTSSEKIEGYVNYKIKRLNKANWRVIRKNNRGRDVSALLVTCQPFLMNYEYLGFVHDKKSERALGVGSEGRSFQYQMWENVVKSREYICNVIQCFTNHPSLGFLTPPEPYYASMLGSLGESWSNCYEMVKTLADTMKLQCKLDKQKSPITLSTSFWCRTEALRPLFTQRHTYEEFPPEPMASDGTLSHAIERIFAYVAQHQGFYTGIMMNQEYASLRGTGLQVLLSDALRELRKDIDIFKPSDIKNCKARKVQLLSFCNQYCPLYIYGAGAYGRRCLRQLLRYQIPVQGFCVSDGKRTEHVVEGQPVYELSEIKQDPAQTGIILAMNRGNQSEARMELAKYGYGNWYCFVEDIVTPERYVIWGTGNIAEHFIQLVDFDKAEILFCVDSNPEKQGGMFHCYPVFSPEILKQKSGFDRLILAMDPWRETWKLAVEEFGIESEKIENAFLYHKHQMLQYYKDSHVSVDKEQKRILDRLEHQPLEVFPYDFTTRYEADGAIPIYDEEAGLYFVMYKGKRMYMRRSFRTVEQVRRYCGRLLAEQDPDSPHRYLNETFTVKNYGVVLDAGAAEGNYSLEIIDNVDRIYLVEADEEWIEALHYTFACYGDKVRIIKGVLSDSEVSGITVDSLIGDDSLDFMKMDVEGAELAVLHGAENTLITNDCKVSVCAYHKEQDEKEITAYLKELGYRVSASKGYMIYIHGDNMLDRTTRKLVRGVLYGEK